MREIRTLLSGLGLHVLPRGRHRRGAILLMNVMSPGVMREMATSLPGIAALVFTGTLWAIAFVLIRRTTRVERMTPLLAGALAALFVAVGLLGVPMVLDRGPLERLAGRVGGAPARRALAHRARCRRARGAARAARGAVDPRPPARADRAPARPRRAARAA